MAIGVQTDMATPALARYGSDELRAEFLAPSIAGDFVACLGVSEVGAGSDVASLKTTARRVGGDWVINGGKMWTTNGTQADWMCLLANTGEGAVHKNKSLICLPMKTKGVQVVKKLDKLGMRSSDTAQIFFDEVKVPVRNLIGQEGMGFIYQMQQFQEERLWGAISAVVGMERLIDETAAYTRERKVFGRPLLDNQIIHFKLAEFRTEIELVRSLCYRACEEYLEGKDVVMLASMAKLKAGRMMRARHRRLPAILGRRRLSLGVADRARLPRLAAGLDRRRRRRSHAADHFEGNGHLAAGGRALMRTAAVTTTMSSRAKRGTFSSADQGSLASLGMTTVMKRAPATWSHPWLSSPTGTKR